MKSRKAKEKMAWRDEPVAKLLRDKGSTPPVSLGLGSPQEGPPPWPSR